jgi:hypothetical protein
MPPSLGRYIGQYVLVSIPALYEDIVARRHRLLGLELQGLWLELEEAHTERVLSVHHHELANPPLTLFVPFAQIACVVLPELGTEFDRPGHDAPPRPRPKAQKSRPRPKAQKSRPPKR